MDMCVSNHLDGSYWILHWQIQRDAMKNKYIIWLVQPFFLSFHPLTYKIGCKFCVPCRHQPWSIVCLDNQLKLYASIVYHMILQLICFQHFELSKKEIARRITWYYLQHCVSVWLALQSPSFIIAILCLFPYSWIQRLNILILSC